MAESQAPAAPAASGKAEPNHGMRILLIWIVLALVADLLIWFLWYPHLPPGRMSESAEHQQFDLAVLALAAAPVMVFVWTYFGYTLINWRHRDGDDDDGPPLFGHTGIQATWIGGTAVIVLAAFVFGTVELIVPAGAGQERGRTRSGSHRGATTSRFRSSASSGSSPTATRSSAGWRPPSCCCPTTGRSRST